MLFQHSAHPPLWARAAEIPAMFPPLRVVHPRLFIASGIHYAMAVCQWGGSRFCSRILASERPIPVTAATCTASAPDTFRKTIGWRSLPLP